MPRILFLDFDGVLHPNLCDPGDWFSNMPVLESAVEGLDVRIVISSSWRFHHDHPSLLRRFPGSLRSMVVGTTGSAFVGRHARHQEILSWISRNPEAGDADSWRALDDAAFEFPKVCAQLIRCDGAKGMSQSEAELVRKWLLR